MTPSPTSNHIVIEPVPERYRGKVLSRKVIWMGNLLGILSVLALLGGVGLTVWGVYQIADHGEQKIPLLALVNLPALLMILFGGILGLYGVVIGLFNPGWLGNRYLLSKACNEFAMRPDAWVRLNDPNLIFIEIVPRENWSRLMLETASDVGFLRISEAERVLIIEGDENRYRIPADALTGCEIEINIQQVGNTRVQYEMIVLTSNQPTGDWELPFRPRKGTSAFGRNKRLKKVQEIQQRIVRMMPQGSSEAMDSLNRFKGA